MAESQEENKTTKEHHPLLHTYHAARSLDPRQGKTLGQSCFSKYSWNAVWKWEEWASPTVQWMVWRFQGPSYSYYRQCWQAPSMWAKLGSVYK